MSNNNNGWAIAEVALHYRYTQPVRERITITSSEAAYNCLLPVFLENIELKECSYVMLLNRANHVIAIHKLSEGGIAGTVIDTKLLFSAAVKTLASGIILSHNHPSGNLQPSTADKQLTKRVKAAAEILDMRLLDHIILTADGYYSFSDSGLI